MPRAKINLEVCWKNIHHVERMTELLGEIEGVVDDMPWRPELSDAVIELRKLIRDGITVKGN